jgi:hypothetical protein
MAALHHRAVYAVGQGHAVIAPGEVVEVPHVEAGGPVAGPVAPAVQAQDALELGNGRFAPRRVTAAPVVQAQAAVLLIAGAPAAQAAGMDAENVGALQPRQRPGQHSTITSWTFMACSTAAAA